MVGSRTRCAGGSSSVSSAIWRSGRCTPPWSTRTSTHPRTRSDHVQRLSFGAFSDDWGIIDCLPCRYTPAALLLSGLVRPTGSSTARSRLITVRQARIHVLRIIWPGRRTRAHSERLLRIDCLVREALTHSLQHAFDSAGRLYNQKGKLEQWWTNKTSEGFNERQKCIVDQYSSASAATCATPGSR